MQIAQARHDEIATIVDDVFCCGKRRQLRYWANVRDTIALDNDRLVFARNAFAAAEQLAAQQNIVLIAICSSSPKIRKPPRKPV